MNHNLRGTVAVLALSVALCAAVRAQPGDLPSSTYYFPRAAGESNLLQALGLSTAKLPEDVVETDDVFRGPLFSYNLKYGLPADFNLEGGVTTNFVTFFFSAGPAWTHRSGPWGFSAGGDLTYWFGQLNQFGFKTSVNGWTLTPNLSAGYAFEKFAITAKGEAIFDLAYTSKNGENEISGDKDFYNGWALGLYLEQPLWKHHVVVIGTRLTSMKFYHPMWAAFSTFERAYTIPEFSFRFVL